MTSPRSLELKKAVLRVLRGAAPSSTSEIAAKVGKSGSLVRIHLRALELEGRVNRMNQPGARGNSVRWVAVSHPPVKATVTAFLDELEESMKAGKILVDLAGLAATRKLISHLEDRLALAQGARPLFDLGEGE